MTTYLLLLYPPLVAAVIALATLGLGAVVARAVRRPGDEPLCRGIWEAALGLLGGTTFLGYLGLAGLLDRRAIVAATVFAACAGLHRLRQLWSQSREIREAAASLTSPIVGESEGPAVLRRGSIVLIGLLFAAVVGVAAAPPIAGDALCYHLELPKRFLQSGSLDFRPYDDNVTFPLLAEMGFLWALAFGSPAAASLVHAWCGLLAAGAGYVLARPSLGPVWSMVVAAVVVLVPGVNNEMTAPLNDVALMLFVSLAVAAWRELRDEADVRSALLLGLLLGGAIGVKYPALVFAAALGVVWPATLVDHAALRRRFPRDVAWVVLAVSVVAGPWYARAAWYRGDPLYPFLSQHEGADGPATFPESKRPLGRGVAAPATAPWAMTMEPERFGGRSFQLGPLFLMCVPAAVALRTVGSFGGPLVIAAIYGVGCLMLRQNVRFLLPIVPILAVVCVGLWRRMEAWPRGPSRAAWAAIGLVLAIQAAIPIARLRHVAPYLLGQESAAEYLARADSSYATALWLTQHLPPESRLLTQEQRAFYVEPQTVRENIFRRATHYDRLLDRPEELATVLRGYGFTHFLTAEAEGSPAAGYDGTLRRCTAAAVAAGAPDAPVLVNHWETADAIGTTRRYRLYSLR